MLPLASRIWMVKLYAKYGNAHEVQRQWRNVSPHRAPTIHAILNTAHKFDETGSVLDANRCGRPVTVLTATKLAEIKRRVQRNMDFSISRGAAASGLPNRTYRRALDKLGFRVYHPQLVAELSDDDYDRRMEFCELWLNKFNEDDHVVDRILWSDESEFKLNGTVNRHNCTYWSRRNLHVQVPVKNSRQGVMVWCGMSSRGLIGPYFFHNSVTGQTYLEMLRVFLWPQIRRHRMLFQQDGAPPHYALPVRQWLDERFPERWIGRRGPYDWPARSPDLTPCDFFLWGYLKDTVYRTRFSTIEQLRGRIRAACSEISEETCRKVCRSVPGRLVDCVDREGRQLPY